MQVGVGIAGDSARLMRDYTEQLSSCGGVAGMVELSHMAATRYYANTMNSYAYTYKNMCSYQPVYQIKL
jgi:hypothetical protein